MKRFVQGMLIMACLFSVQRPPLADEHESVEALAARLIELAHMDETMEQMLQAMLAELRNLADRAVEEGRSSATPEQLAEFEDIMREEMTAMRMDMIGPMTDMAVKFYTSNFSKSELMELVDIYGSPTFQKQYEFMPELTVQVLRLTQTYQVAHEKRLDERMRAFRAKHGIE